MAGRLHNIDREIQRCMSELDTQSLMIDTQSCMPGGNNRKKSLRNAELRALEAEVFGNMQDTRIKGRLGALYGGSTYVPSASYYVVEDGDIQLARLGDTQSCLSGDLYRKGTINDFRIHVETKQFFLDNVTYTIVVHSTQNRKGDNKVCAISLFQNKTFLTYLFSTNDPLAFDNFNCFKGFEHDPAARRLLKCCEQLVFCENKVKLAQSFLRGQTPASLKAFAAVNRINPNLVLNLFGDDHRLKTDMTLIDSNTSLSRGDRVAQKLQVAKDYIAGIDESYFYAQYFQFLNEKLDQNYDLVPGDFYKDVGQMVILSKTELDDWDSIAMMCVCSARMKQLKSSPHERGLVSAMIARSVIESSEFDDKWAEKWPAGVKSMRWYADDESGQRELLRISQKQTKYQEEFIHHLKTFIIDGNVDGALAMLFDKSNKNGLLGLSEKIIQSIWTGVLDFESLVDGIRAKLGVYGIDFELYNPTLMKSASNPFKVATSIGSPLGA